MHGIIVKGLKDYVVGTYDRNTWRSVQDLADVERRLYVPDAQYPDRHGTELASATRSLTGVHEADLEFDVGRHLAPTLLQVYGAHAREVGSGLDVLASAESVIEEALRRKGTEDDPAPKVTGERLDEDTVVLQYRGDHCAGLRGVAFGIGEYFGVAYTVTERACVDGDSDRCELVVRRSDAGPCRGLAASDD